MGADTKKMRNLRPICPGGEIGRRDSFRFYWIHVLVGSSPVPGTLYYFSSLRGCLFLIRKHRHAFDFFLHKIANCCFRNRSTDLGRLIFLVGSSSVAKQCTATYTKKPAQLISLISLINSKHSSTRKKTKGGQLQTVATPLSPY